MELYFFKNKIIREVKGELIHCFAYSDFDLSADLCGLNLKPFIDAGIDISNTSLTFGKSSVSCPLKPSDSAPLKHSTMPP